MNTKYEELENQRVLKYIGILQKQNAELINQLREYDSMVEAEIDKQKQMPTFGNRYHLALGKLFLHKEILLDTVKRINDCWYAKL